MSDKSKNVDSVDIKVGINNSDNSFNINNIKSKNEPLEEGNRSKLNEGNTSSFNLQQHLLQEISKITGLDKHVCTLQVQTERMGQDIGKLQEKTEKTGEEIPRLQEQTKNLNNMFKYRDKLYYCFLVALVAVAGYFFFELKSVESSYDQIKGKISNFTVSK